MTLWLIVRKSLRQHALSTGITAVSIALATGLLMSIVSVKEQSMRAFTSVNGGFDAVMGSRGSELSLVLFSVFHMDQAPGTLLWEEYEFITGKANRRFIQRAVPIVVGDNYHDFRIVGTTAEFFEVPYANDRKYTLTTGGRIFHEDAQETVVGSYVAQKLGLRVGDIIQPYHGLSFDPTQKHDVDYLIVGILKPSNTPTDHAIWIPLSGAQNMPGHSAEKATDISAILLQFNARSQAPQFAEMVNKNTRDKTVAVIAPTVSRFFSRFQWLGTVLGGMAGLVALVKAAHSCIRCSTSAGAMSADAAMRAMSHCPASASASARFCRVLGLASGSRAAAERIFTPSPVPPASAMARPRSVAGI